MEKYAILNHHIGRVFLQLLPLYLYHQEWARTRRLKWGEHMDAAKRIQLIRTIEKMKKNPTTCRKLGIQNKSVWKSAEAQK